MDLMETLGWERNTFTAKCSAWKQFFKHWRREGLNVLDPDSIPLPDREVKFPKILEKEEYQKLLQALDSHPKNIHRLKGMTALRVLWDTGVRINEFLSMKVADMDIKEMHTIIKTEKSKGIKPVRMVFWTKETNQYLKDYIAARAELLKEKGFKDEEGWLWIAAHGRWNCGAAWTDRAISILLKRLSNESNLGFTANAHRFRHHFGRNLSLKGANGNVISDMMGHAKIESTRIYTVMNEKMMEETYRKYNRK
jgi:integrase/recombinase XerD